MEPNLMPPAQNESSEGFFVCRVCDEVLNDRDELKGHERTHLESCPSPRVDDPSEVSSVSDSLAKDEARKRPASEDLTLLEELEGPPIKKRRGSNSSAVTIECDESLSIDVNHERSESPGVLDSSEVASLRIISTIEEIRDMIQKMLDNVPGNQDEAASRGNRDLWNPCTKDVSSIPEIIDISSDGETEHSLMSKDGRNPEGKLETSQGGTGKITSSETNLISGGIQATEEVYLESNQTASVFDHDHDMEQCTEVQILHVCSECHLSFDSQKSLDGHMGPCLFKHINFNHILIDSPEDTPRLNGIDSTSTVRVPCNQVSQQEALPSDTAITAAGLSVAAERIPVNDPATTATGQLLEINEAASDGTELLENFVNRLETTCIANATLHTGAVQNTDVVRQDEAPLLTTNAGSNTNSCLVVTDALLNTDNTVLRTDTGAVTDAVSNKDNDVCSPTNGIGAADSYINADKSLKTSSDPLGGLDETAIVITSVIGNYSLPAVTQTEVVPTGDAAIVQGPLESEPLESVGTLPPTPISFKCQICTASLPTIKEFLKHLRDHGEKHICSICGKVCKSKSGLTRHFRCAHWLEELLPSLPSPSSGVPVRPVILNEDANLDMSSLSGEEFRCELCPKVFPTRALYLMHLKIFHRLNVSAGLDTNSKSSDSFGSCISASNENSMEVISPTGNEQCQFKCNLCSNSFILEPLLNHHLETAHGFSVLY